MLPVDVIAPVVRELPVVDTVFAMVSLVVSMQQSPSNHVVLRTQVYQMRGMIHLQQTGVDNVY